MKISPRTAAPATSVRGMGSGGPLCHVPAMTPAAATISAITLSVYEEGQSVHSAHDHLVAWIRA